MIDKGKAEFCDMAKTRIVMTCFEATHRDNMSLNSKTNVANQNPTNRTDLYIIGAFPISHAMNYTFLLLMLKMGGYRLCSRVSMENNLRFYIFTTIGDSQ